MSCVFCDGGRAALARGSRLVWEGVHSLALSDARPRAAVHLLLCSKEHIEDLSRLERRHIPLLEEMLAIAPQLAESEYGGDVAGKLALGFHRWPWVSVKHLHMHVLVPPYRFGQAWRYQPALRTMKEATAVLEELQR
eukprot:PLAT7265.1.p1 GENE.PLAT7265.1~~PLAT7265.1.p1  ORF type:complete len:137 (+),score=40.44 PLAT7265.1:95-505(+)